MHMLRFHGIVQPGIGAFSRRMTEFATLFEEATGEALFAGTLNVSIDIELEVREHFKIVDPIDANQDLLFEICRVSRLWAYRILPRNRYTGDGGHGDHIIEVCCAQHIPNAGIGSRVELEFFR